MFTVIRRLAGLAWKYGLAAVNRAITWVRNNRATVELWIRRGGYGFAVDMVLRTLGIL